MLRVVGGVDIKGSDAVIVLLEGTKESPRLVPTKIVKIPLGDHTEQDCVHSFRNVIETLLSEYNVTNVCIRGRASKGHYAASGESFKVEAIIQLMDIPVLIVPYNTLKAAEKKHPNAIGQVEIHKYQSRAFWAAFYVLEP